MSLAALAPQTYTSPSHHAIAYGLVPGYDLAHRVFSAATERLCKQRRATFATGELAAILGADPTLAIRAAVARKLLDPGSTEAELILWSTPRY